MFAEDQDLDTTPVEEEVLDALNVKEQDVQETSEQTEEEPAQTPETTETETPTQTPEQLISGLQKGYTQTRQDVAEIKRTLEELRGPAVSAPEAPVQEAVQPQTWNDVLAALRQEDQRKEQMRLAEQAKTDARIDGWLHDLAVQGKVTTKEEQDKLIDFAVEHKIPDLVKAQAMCEQIEVARQEGMKEGLKGKVKGEAGSKIGTSQKASVEEGKRTSYSEIHNKSFFDL